MNTARVADILQLSIPEQIQLVEDVWDNIAAHAHSVKLTREQKGELDHRLTAHQKHPTLGSDWASVKTKIKRL